MNYPNKIKPKKGARIKKQSFPNDSFRNRGMSLEEDIQVTNKFYLDTNKAIIYKKPTPIQIVKVHYPKRSAAVITEGYFQAKSTTDFNGIYRGQYIDFEAKETKNKTRFPLANIHAHQFEHMKSIVEHKGICFAIIRFTVYDETYLISADKLITIYQDYEKIGKKSIPYETMKQMGHLIPFKYPLRVDYLSIVDQLYF